MSSAHPTQSELKDLVAKALRNIEAQEAAYETTAIGQLVAMRARTHGSTTAVKVFERGESATYAEMDQWSNKYAHALHALGMRKGDCVGVMLPNRIEFPIIWFALAKLGAVMVPINKRYTPREVEYVLSDTKARFALVDGSLWPVFSNMEPWPQDLARERVILVGSAGNNSIKSLEQLLAGASDAPVEADVSADDLLNINYTSGTTGFPKGCMLTHDRWAVGSYQATFLDYEPCKSYLAAGPFSYVEGQTILLTSYRQGGTFYLAQQLSSSRFIDWIRQHRIESASIPELIARQAEAEDIDGAIGLKQATVWGWDPESVRKFRKRFRSRTREAFGMTEIGRGTQMPGELDVNNGSVGLRAAFRRLRIVNDDGTPTPDGEIGELWVGGRGLFKGYWNKPDANAELFDGEWFKTGDLFQRDELGFYWIVGRKKDVIRRSAENIAAREVEAVICEIRGIADVAAVPVPDPKRGEEVKIYVELKEGVSQADVSVDRILEHARAHLAAFKVPRYIAFSASLPRADTKARVLKRELTAIKDPFSGAYDAEEKRWR